MPPRIQVASQNPVKSLAVRDAFTAMFGSSPTMSTVAVASGVSDQPMSDDETRQGAFNRAQSARENDPDHDFYAGVEGGIEDHPSGMLAFAWIVILGEGAAVGQSRTATFPLPNRIAQLVREGSELGEADDIVFGVSNSKQDVGAVGLLTNSVVDRKQLYQHAAQLAFIPFLSKNADLFRRA